MDVVQTALNNLRKFYNDHKQTLPSQQRIAELTNLSESTIQRALGGQTNNVKYTSIMEIASAIGMKTTDLGITEEVAEQLNEAQTTALVLALRKINIEELRAQREADDARWRERLASDQRKHAERIDSLNAEHAAEMRRTAQMHIDEINRINADHEQEISRCRERHDHHVEQIHQIYARQMESMREVNARQIETMLDGHNRQIEAVQSVDKAQRDSVQAMATEQKTADEKSKEFLKAEIAQRDNRIAALDKRDRFKSTVIMLLIILIILLFVADFLMPHIGWIRRVAGNIFTLNAYRFG